MPGKGAEATLEGTEAVTAGTARLPAGAEAALTGAEANGNGIDVGGIVAGFGTLAAGAICERFDGFIAGNSGIGGVGLVALHDPRKAVNIAPPGVLRVHSANTPTFCISSASSLTWRTLTGSACAPNWTV